MFVCRKDKTFKIRIKRVAELPYSLFNSEAKQSGQLKLNWNPQIEADKVKKHCSNIYRRISPYLEICQIENYILMGQS